MNNHEQRLTELEHAIVWLGLTCIGLSAIGLVAITILCKAVVKHQETLNAIINK